MPDPEKKEGKLPDGWVTALDFEGPVPKFLWKILTDSPVPLAKERPAHEGALEAVEDAFRSAVHKLYNDCCRILAVGAEGRQSECNWENTESLGRTLHKLVSSEWADEDLRGELLAAQREEKLARYRRLRGETAALARELGLEGSETS
jgi:hypothetical protein